MHVAGDGTHCLDIAKLLPHIVAAVQELRRDHAELERRLLKEQLGSDDDDDDDDEDEDEDEATPTEPVRVEGGHQAASRELHCTDPIMQFEECLAFSADGGA